MNTLFKIELYSQAEKNRVLDGLILLIKKNETKLTEIERNKDIPWKWREKQSNTIRRHIIYLESLFLRIKTTKGKRPKYASQRSNSNETKT